MKVLVYGAASSEIDKSYVEQGERLGEELAKRGYSLIFGAGDSGMMGAVARGVYRKREEHGVTITGVVPNFFPDGEVFEHCTELVRTETMRQRKQAMEDMADAFLTTPGGIGTFEEFFEIITLIHLKQEHKPMILVNLNGYYNHLIKFLEVAGKERFMSADTEYLYQVANSVEEAVELLEKALKQA